MWTLSARDEAALRDISGAVHDAYLDGPPEHRRAERLVVVPFLQEGWPGGPPSEEVPVHDGWRYRESRITFFRGRLIVGHVREMHGADEWADERTIYSVDFDPAADQVRICSGECLRLSVDALAVEVEVSQEAGGYVHRCVGRFTNTVGDVWL